ncbi:MAG: bacillithiol biosynthesis deacetylase BshB1 [Planctomycetes bacterium]|nr:bacillithiol biosynthesis deacetylase BshB1 [Planctomycetota bacterium]
MPKAEPVHADIVCLAPHPDDAELCCGGLLLKARDAGLAVGIVDCTQGEMGTRGSVAQRRREAAAADRVLGTACRVNLGLPDGHLRDDDSLREPLVAALRAMRPRVVLAPHWEDQHPDHATLGRAAESVAFLCGAPKYAPASAKGVASPDRLPYRPELVLYYNNRYGIDPHVVVDVSDVFARKIKLVQCYATQFGPGPKKKGKGKGDPQTKLSSAAFLGFLRAMHGFYGFKIGAAYGEAYCVKGPLPVRGMEALLPESGKK